MSTKLQILIALLFAIQISFAANKSNIDAKPNIIYILADDMGQGDVSAYNPKGKIITPNIDRLANEGMLFTNAHTNSSVCTPTRYGIMTGRYAWRTHLKSQVLGGRCPALIAPERETVATYLQKQGYATACVGKWHLGMNWQTVENPKRNKGGRLVSQSILPNEPITQGPNTVGFDYYFGIPGSLNMSPHLLIENDKVSGESELLKMDGIKAKGMIGAQSGWVQQDFDQEKVLSILAEKSCNWIKENKEKPFFLYFPLPSPHSPIVPSDKFKGVSNLNPHGDFCVETDWVVGQILNTIDELGLAENTIVVYTADNGTSSKADFATMEAKGHYSSMQYRGCKGSLFEGGHRVPFLVRWPEAVKANKVSQQAICTTDLLATCANIFNDKLPDNVAEDSESFLPALQGKTIPGVQKRAIIHHSGNGSFAVRQGKWKLVLSEDGGDQRTDPKDKPIVNSAPTMLFDLDKDIEESTNVSAQYPEVVVQLKKELAVIINNGRSTKGKPQQNDPLANSKTWSQLEIIQEYIK